MRVTEMPLLGTASCLFSDFSCSLFLVLLFSWVYFFKHGCGSLLLVSSWTLLILHHIKTESVKSYCLDLLQYRLKWLKEFLSPFILEKDGMSEHFIFVFLSSTWLCFFFFFFQFCFFFKNETHSNPVNVNQNQNFRMPWHLCDQSEF